ncbi:MAG: hypothetical protein M3O36_13415 [Myxococcota bacterium]|nr:hypothetical protein [Myxococcota bacterium]
MVVSSGACGGSDERGTSSGATDATAASGANDAVADAASAADSGTSGGGAFGSGTPQLFGGEGNGQREAGLSDASLTNDGQPPADGATACVAVEAGAAPFPQRCVTATANECDGPTDRALQALGVASGLLNGRTGNGFDDDCDGLVDEGCPCPGNGLTKPCYLVPASQINPQTGQAVGWCKDNALGSLDCAGLEFPSWSGVCRGAQAPYRHDVCAPGDFNCDGLAANSDVQDCSCAVVPVQCPTLPVVEVPYPDAKSIREIDGAQWITDPALPPTTTNWTWTVIGGDCDNVLPHPTFAIYDRRDSTVPGARKGKRTTVQFDHATSPPRYVARPSQPLVALQAMAYGSGLAGARVFPAFGLSGDYLVQGEWDLGGVHYVCTQKVQVRAPGIRAELCWDTVGGEETIGAAGNDIDLHFARLQGVNCNHQGWDLICAEGPTFQDCFFDQASGCRDGSGVGPSWGYPDSPASACLGWSSKRHSVDGLQYFQGCTNPRLDKDNIYCDKSIDDPTVDQTALGNEFCGPENINLDNPREGDRFAIGVNHFGNSGGSTEAKPHVNLYCNGERVLSAGYNPLTGQTRNPLLINPGTSYSGDFWEVGQVTAHVAGGQLTSCDVVTVPSHHADPMRDGPGTMASSGNQICVDSQSSHATPAYNYRSHDFVENQPLQGGTNGALPVTAGAFCKH